MIVLSSFDYKNHKKFLESLHIEFAVSKHYGFVTIKSSNNMALNFNSTFSSGNIIASNILTYHMGGDIEYHSIDKKTLFKLLLMNTLEQIEYLYNVYGQ